LITARFFDFHGFDFPAFKKFVPFRYSRPFFTPQSLPAKSPCRKAAQKPGPRLSAALWGTYRTAPAQGRAAYTLSVVRRQPTGGKYCPSPSPPGFPLYQEK
jgi:hypothetical protein